MSEIEKKIEAEFERRWVNLEDQISLPFNCSKKKGAEILFKAGYLAAQKEIKELEAKIDLMGDMNFNHIKELREALDWTTQYIIEHGGEYNYQQAKKVRAKFNLDDQKAEK